jgi:hypothetical protein
VGDGGFGGDVSGAGGGLGGGTGDLPRDPSLLDPPSGLFNQSFFMAMVDLRMTACRRMLRPLAVGLFEVVDGLPDRAPMLTDAAVVARVAGATLRASDVCARLADGTYGLLLEDTPEDGAVWTIERLRRALGTRPGGRTLRAGVACYPGHALVAPDVLACAAAALTAARAWPQDRTEVAVAD